MGHERHTFVEEGIVKSSGMIIVSKFRFGDKVRIEGGDIVGVLTTVSTVWRDHEPLCQYEVAWFHNGSRYMGWFYDWQLKYEGTMIDEA